MTLIISSICCICLILTPLTFAEKLSPSSKITEVTVYPDRALINRAAALELKPGFHEIVFSHLPSTLLEESMRVSGRGASQVKLLGVEAGISFLEKSPEESVRALEKEIEGLKDKEKAFTDELGLLKARREFFSSIKLYSAEQLSKEIVTKEPKIEDWKHLVQFIAEGYEEISLREQEINKEVRELRNTIQVKEKTLNEIRGAGRKAEKEVVVDIEAVKGGYFELNLAYVLPGAGWAPLYDARAMEEARAIHLSYQALVRQSSGEDWDNVNLILSTARPAIGAKMPEIQPWYLGGAERKKDYGIGLLKSEMQSLEERDEMSEAITPLAEAIDVGTSVIFKIPAKSDIPSDNKLHKVTISIDTLQAKMGYIATPKLSPYVYLRSEATNMKDFPLLAGNVNVFLGDNYIGTSQIKNIASNEKFELDLGIDEGLKVKRESIKELRETSFFGKKVRNNYVYKITLENHKRTKESVIVIDQIPLSRNEEVVVKLLEGMDKPGEQDEKGILKWKFLLSPGEKKEIKLGFFIESPKDFYIPEL